MYFVKTPHITKLFYPHQTWRIKDPAKNIYITFDDGPDPAVTPDVLELLDQFQAKATFFCVGEKVSGNQTIYKAILDKGHTTGNHSFNHLNGRKTSTPEYIENIYKAAEIIDSRLFRPPYGKITSQQIRELNKSFDIVMWSVLPGDFDRSVSKENVLKRSIKYTKNGSIVVFHDNVKFDQKMLFTLRGFLEHFSRAGYNFKAITKNLI